MNDIDLYLEAEELLDFDMRTGNIKVDKRIFDDFRENTHINISFVDDRRDGRIVRFVMTSEDNDGINMKYLSEWNVKGRK